jgi:hypothetical protein
MSNEVQNGGIGFSGLLAIVFSVLKLTHYIDWTWFWVLSPILIPLIILFGILGVVLIFWIIAFIIKVIDEKRKRVKT